MLKGFKPVIAIEPKIMILGSMPSIKSLEQVEYYAHKTNRFWKIMSELFNEPINTYQQKQAIILNHHLLLWDVIDTCIREGSLDSNIKEVVVNDIEGIIKKYPSITCIICNGKKSYELYLKHFKHLNIKVISLPSTSSANQSIKQDELFKVWIKTIQEELKRSYV